MNRTLAALALIVAATFTATPAHAVKGVIATGPGSPPTECKAGMEKEGGLCYPVCASGYWDQVTRCIKECSVQVPGAYLENPGVCAYNTTVNGWFVVERFTPDSYDRGAGTVPTVCAAGMTKVSGLCYATTSGGA